MEDLPGILLPVLDTKKDALGKDKMLLGTLNVISGLLPDTLYGLYAGKTVHSNLYNIIFGLPASSKGDLESVKYIAKPINDEKKKKYEKEMESYNLEKAEWESRSGRRSNRDLCGLPPKEPVK